MTLEVTDSMFFISRYEFNNYNLLLIIKKLEINFTLLFLSKSI
jgi:hypothetical protein